MEGLFDALDIPILSARINAEVTRDISWNSFPGSVIHGVVGFRLKDLTCVISHRNCSKCYLVRSCPYGIVYESLQPVGTTRMKLYPQAPHPVVVTVYPWDRPVLMRGERFEITVTLFGRAITNFLLILLALEAGMSGGIGRKHEGRRGVAKLVSVYDNITGKEESWLTLKENITEVISSGSLKELAEVADRQRLTLKIKSPLKIVTGNKANFNPGIRDILSSLLRRLGNISFFYSNKELTIDYKKILDIASSLKYESRLNRTQAIRYSGRQNKTISMAGVTGDITIFDCHREIASLLMAGSYVGVGKGTTMGMGNYSIR